VVIGPDSVEFVLTVDGLVVIDAIQFKGKSERRDKDVEFGLDGVFPVEVNLKVWVEGGELFFEPSLYLGTSCSVFLVKISPSGRTRTGAEVVL